MSITTCFSHYGLFVQLSFNDMLCIEEFGV